MRGIFQNGGQLKNFQILISLFSYFLWSYNWLSWLLLHWAMLLVPSEHFKPLPLSCPIIGWKAWFPRFSSSSFFFKTCYPCPIRDSWVSFFTVLQRLGRGCASCETIGLKEERRHLLVMNFMVVTVRGFLVWHHLNYCSCDTHEYNYLKVTFNYGY